MQNLAPVGAVKGLSLRIVLAGFGATALLLVAGIGWLAWSLSSIEKKLDASSRQWFMGGPIRSLSFTQSLDVRRYDNEVRTAIEELVLLPGLDEAKRVLLSKKYTVRVLKDGKKQLHDAQGKVVAFLRDGAVPAIKASAISATVFGIAHMLASTDVSTKLTAIETRLDKLLEFRRIDQAATLERIYTTAQELLSGPRTAATEAEVRRLRADLRQLRSSWRQEFALHLSNINERSTLGNWLDWMKFWEPGTGRADDQISEVRLQLSLVEYALRLDQALAIASDSWDVSRKSLRSELDELDKVQKLLALKAGYVAKNSQPATEAKKLVDGMAELIAGYRSLAPEPI